MKRHFTVTGFVVSGGYCLLHWHRKVKMWLPPGGHIDANEDPEQAVLREIHEETGVHARVAPTGPPIALDYPAQVPAPFTIMVEDIDDPVDGHHQHIDLIYFCEPTDADAATQVNDGWLWVSAGDIAAAKPLQAGDSPRAAPPEDVRVLAAHAFAAADGRQARRDGN